MSNVKFNAKGFVKLVLFIGFLALVIFLVFTLTNVPKTPATVPQVKELLISMGYYPQDTTEQYKEQSPGSNLIESLGVQQDDIRFEFFEFGDDNGALSARRAFYSIIVESKKRMPYAEHDTKQANYSIYTLTSSGEYSVVIRVGHTVVYAYCNEENSEKISNILREIGYFEE